MSLTKSQRAAVIAVTSAIAILTVTAIVVYVRNQGWRVCKAPVSPPVCAQPPRSETVTPKVTESPPRRTTPPNPNPFDALVVDSQLPEGLPPDVTTTADNTIVVRLPHRDKQKGFFAGSGVLVADGLALVSAHVLENGRLDQIDIRCNGRTRKGELVEIDYIADYALVSVECPATERIIDPRPLRDGETLYVSGYSFQTDGLFATARRYAVKTIAFPKLNLPIDRNVIDSCTSLRLEATSRLHLPPISAIGVELTFGNSGSAVLDSRGRIVGLIAMNEGGKGRSWAVPAATFAAKVRSHVLKLKNRHRQPAIRP